MEKTKQWFFRGWVAGLLAVLGIVFFIACSVNDEVNNFDNGSVGIGNAGTTSQSRLRFSVGLRGEDGVLDVESGQLQKKDGRWVISMEWLPKYQGRVSDLEIKAVGTYLPDEIKNASVATNVTLLVQGKNVYEATVEEEQTTAIYDPTLGGWVERETNFAMINKTDSAMLVMMFSTALNNFARSNGATIQRPITLLVEFNEVVVGEYEELIVTHTVTWNTDGGSPAPAQTLVNRGGSIVAPETISKAGFVFGGWFTIDGAEVEFPITNVTGDITLFAKWIEAPKYNAPLRADLKLAISLRPIFSSPERPTIPTLDSWTDGVRNFHIIHLGWADNTLLMRTQILDWSGNTNQTLSVTQSRTNTMSTSRTNIVSNSFRVEQGGGSSSTHSLENTRSFQDVTHQALNSSLSAGFPVKLVTIGANIAHTIENTKTHFQSTTNFFSQETSRTFNHSEERSTATEESTIQTISETISQTNRMELVAGVNQRGSYRYAWYAVSDFYLIVSTSLDNENLLSADVVSAVRDDVIVRDEFSANGTFNNSPTDNLLVLPEEFWKRLPAPETFDLTVTPTEDGTVSPSGTVIRNNREIVTVTATANEGYVFSGWTSTTGSLPAGVSAQSPEITFTMTSAIMLIANFTLAEPTTFDLTVTATPTAGGTVSPTGITTYNSGTQVTVTATPANGYEFVNWTGSGAPAGAAANNSSISVTMNSNLTLTANFRLRQYTLTINHTNGSVSRNPNQITYNHGTQVALTATPNSGYKFVNWAGTGAPTGVAANNPVATITMNSNLTLTANFALLERRQTTQTFTFNQNYTLPSNVRYPAEVEIYVLGAGGGGQGGHRYERCGTLSDNMGGGAGGGGAAAYRIITVNQSTQFNVTIGSGGSGGTGFNMRGVDLSNLGTRCDNRGPRTSGNPGINGGSTSVIWGGNTLTAGGGIGGGGTGGNRNGGNGGSASGVLTASANGERGGDGSQTGSAGNGGSAGTVRAGSVNPFSDSGRGRGGNGGYDHTNSGSRGSDGEARIVITWWD